MTEEDQPDYIYHRCSEHQNVTNADEQPIEYIAEDCGIFADRHITHNFSFGNIIPQEQGM